MESGKRGPNESHRLSSENHELYQQNVTNSIVQRLANEASRQYSAEYVLQTSISIYTPVGEKFCRCTHIHTCTPAYRYARTSGCTCAHTHVQAHAKRNSLPFFAESARVCACTRARTTCERERQTERQRDRKRDRQGQRDIHIPTQTQTQTQPQTQTKIQPQT